MKLKANTKGFTMVELLISFAIMVLLFAITVGAYKNYTKHQALKRDAETVASILRNARSLTLTGKGGVAYGVHLASSTVTLFTAPTYATSTATNQVTELNSGITLDTDVGGNPDVVFSRLTGEANLSATLNIYMRSAVSSTTIRVYRTGVVEKY
jgi:type II secretory pathway pseudopilin PulG